MEKPSESITKHLNEIKEYRDKINEIINHFTMYAKRESKNRNLEDEDPEKFLEFETEDDFIVAAYTLTGYLALSAFYVERIDFHVTEICVILKKEFDVTDEAINNFYTDIVGPFYIKNGESEMIFNLFVEPFLYNSRKEFLDIYKNDFYAPKGKKYLSKLKKVIYEAYRMSTHHDNIMGEYINVFKDLLKLS
ncbi:MAG TPA: hypothetical protein PKW37_05860 [Salinivirgaceae bacterium]|nr:hypothetical protein [Salinivirgaceae bacterium]